MIIYLSRNLINGKCYVGQTRNSLNSRVYRHKHTALNSSKPRSALHHAIHKYGLDAFEWSVLSECDSLDALDTSERAWITQLNSLAPNGYNLTVGGNAGGLRSDVTKEKIRAIRTGKKHRPESIAKMSNAALAENLSPETRARMSASQSDRSLETRLKISISKRGENSPAAKLTWEKVREIRLHASTGPYDTAVLAVQYGVTVTTINKVIGNRSWVE